MFKKCSFLGTRGYAFLLLTSVSACGFRADEPAFTVTYSEVEDPKSETINSNDRSKAPSESLPQGSFDQEQQNQNQSGNNQSGFQWESPDGNALRKDRGTAASGEHPEEAKGASAANENPSEPNPSDGSNDPLTVSITQSENTPSPDSPTGPIPSPTPSVTITPASSATPTQVPSPVPSSTPAESPTPTIAPSPTPTPFIDIVDEVKDLCEKRPIQRVNKVLEFRPMTQNCTWFPSGFEGLNYMQGVSGQTPVTRPELPDRAVLCSLELSSESQGASTWVYDDEFYFTLNKKVIVSSHTNSLARFTQTDSFYDYDFTKLIGMRYQGDRGGGIYCYGHDSMSTQNKCVFPATETVATVSYQVNQSQASKIGALVKSTNELNFELFVTGDNDPRIDCRHGGLKLDLSLYYVTQ